MVYLLKPVNCPYDPEEPLPTPLGFISLNRCFPGADDLKREYKPVPANLVYPRMDVGGDRPMPDCFYTQLDYFFVSSRFRSVLEEFARGQVEYIEVELTMPAQKKPADAYYFINILGRSQLMNWELSQKRSRGVGFHFLDGTPDKWVMRSPTVDHVAIWHEIDHIEKDETFFGSGTRVFVTDGLGDALDVAFPGQCRLRQIQEM